MFWSLWNVPEVSVAMLCLRNLSMTSVNTNRVINALCQYNPRLGWPDPGNHLIEWSYLYQFKLVHVANCISIWPECCSPTPGLLPQRRSNPFCKSPRQRGLYLSGFFSYQFRSMHIFRSNHVQPHAILNKAHNLNLVVVFGDARMASVKVRLKTNDTFHTYMKFINT